MRQLEKAALFLASAGTAFVWLAPYLLSGLPTWVASRYYLLICAPAVLLGAGAYPRYGRFAKSASLIACICLIIAGIAWTDTTELGRALLLFAGFAVTLPIAALINKHDSWPQFARNFAYATLLTMAVAAPRVSPTMRWGTILDRESTFRTYSFLTNSDTVGLQTGLAAVLLMIAAPRRMRVIGLYLPALMLLLLLVRSATLTAFVAVASTLLIAWIWRARNDAFGAFAVAAPVIVAAVAAVLFVASFTPQSFQRMEDRILGADPSAAASLQDRKLMITYGLERLAEGRNWLTGFGSGGPDKILAESSEIRTVAIGRDGVRRTYCHNTFLWWTMCFGLLGVILCGWLAWDIWRKALRRDVTERSWIRVGFLAYMAVAGMGGVINQEPFWIAVGSLLWAILSTERTAVGRTRIDGFAPSREFAAYASAKR
jgi:hypothetical protein